MCVLPIECFGNMKKEKKKTIGTKKNDKNVIVNVPNTFFLYFPFRLLFMNDHAAAH